MERTERGGETVDQILRLPRVIEIVGLGRSTIYDLAARGLFPRAVQLGPRTVGWRRSEVQAWIVSRVSVRRGGR